MPVTLDQIVEETRELPSETVAKLAGHSSLPVLKN